MRILIVEDEEGIASFVGKGLRAEGFSVDWAADDRKGLWLAKTNTYDLIVLDIKLPEKDGIEICRELRKEKKTLPIIMLTVKSETATKVEALNAGADDYLTKPFSFEELLARIRALLRRPETIVGPKLKVNDLELDTLSHTVVRGSKSIQLSKKEFTLLEYFMRNAGITLTRNMILEHVWDMNVDPFTNTVDVHVRFLREKIDSRHRRKLLHTIHGIGYKME
ncbi:response regulator transcription factor [Patescibacteria group bacterium]|nr:response regulator transcription factor [Patescibacteria group bacterium]